MAFVKVQQTLALELSELQRQAGALDAQIVRKLLARKRDVEFICAKALRLGGEVGQKLGTRGALAHVRELFAEAQVFFGQLAQKVADDPAVVRAGGGADVQNALHV